MTERKRMAGETKSHEEKKKTARRMEGVQHFSRYQVCQQRAESERQRTMMPTTRRREAAKIAKKSRELAKVQKQR